MACRLETPSHLVRSLFAIFLICLLKLEKVDASAVGWTYYEPPGSTGPEFWKINFPDCGGVMQSPINIETNAIVYDKNLQPFDVSDYTITEGVEMKLINVGGHTAEVEVAGRALFLKGGNLPDDYQLKQFHFHWGCNSSRGSEHALNGKFAPLEIHLVHTQKRFPTTSIASEHPFGLAVIGVFFEVSEHNPKYEPLIDQFVHILNANDAIEINPIAVFDLLPSDPRDYFRYEGSLTTPPCYESVIWSILQNPIPISAEQLEKFRELHNANSGALVDDYRPLQLIDRRTVRTNSNFYNDEAASCIAR